MSKQNNEALKKLILEEVRKVLSEGVEKKDKFIDIKGDKNAK